MGVVIGVGPGKYPSAIDHVSNGEQASEQVLRRPSVQLENRTEALRTLSENTEMTAAGLTDRANTHEADNSRHTVFATAQEAKEGTSTVLTLSPALVKSLFADVIGTHYDAVVGAEGVYGVTHTSLQDALTALTQGGRIFVAVDLAIDAAVTVATNDVEIIGKKGKKIVFTAGNLVLNASHSKIHGLTISTPEAYAITVGAAATRTTIEDVKCMATDTVDDSGEFTNIRNVYVVA